MALEIQLPQPRGGDELLRAFRECDEDLKKKDFEITEVGQIYAMKLSLTGKVSGPFFVGGSFEIFKNVNATTRVCFRVSAFDVDKVYKKLDLMILFYSFFGVEVFELNSSHEKHEITEIVGEFLSIFYSHLPHK